MTTTDRLIFALKLFSALGCGLMAGVFFAFSVFVMSALKSLPHSEGLAAMQAINIRVINPVFLGVFMGTTAACAVLAVLSLLKWQQPGAAFFLVGALLYLVGTFGVTGAFNVPLNDGLATVKPSQTDAATLWAGYVAVWTAWNHVRTLAAIAAMASIIFGLCAQKPQ